MVNSRGFCMITLNQKSFKPERNYSIDIEKMLCLPANVYWLDRNCISLGCNENTLEILGVKSVKDYVGMNYQEMADVSDWKDGQGESFKNDDKEVIVTGLPKYNVEEPLVIDQQGKPRYYLTSRFPLEDLEGNIVGVFGISFDITERTLLAKSQFLRQLLIYSQIGANSNLQRVTIKTQQGNIILTERERECLFQVVKGKSAREIGLILHRSYRTIEDRIDSVKNKFNCRTKSELLEKLFDENLLKVG
jgi:DNA-binding CsgD family transcriptional regulator